MRRVLFATVLLCLAVSTTQAQDPVKLDPKHYKVEFENAQVRVLRIHYGPHEKSMMHEHPAAVAVFLTDGRAKFNFPDGKAEERSWKAGESRWLAAEKHLPEQLGDKPNELILVELKGKPAAAKPPTAKALPQAPPAEGQKAAPFVTQRGAITVPQNLGEMMDEAATIVRGHVASVRVEPHPEFENLNTIVVTLRVDEVLKGQAGETFTFRQFIWDIRDKRDAAGYGKAQHLLLLMTKPSQYGLASPVGLEQGRFRVEQDKDGKLVAVNGHENVGLFTKLDQQMAGKGIRLPRELSAMIADHRAGPVPLADLEQLIRAVAGGK